MKGFLVERKAGWDTHGLPVEIGVEKSLGLLKKISGKRFLLKITTKPAAGGYEIQRSLG